MTELENLFIAVAILLIAAFYFLFRLYVHKKYGKKKKGYILIPCSESTENLETLVKGYYWEEVFENEDYGREIILVQMEKSSKYYEAKRLEQEYSIVSCVDISELSDFLKKRELKCWRG